MFVVFRAGKIPKNMLSAYQSACEKVTTEQIEGTVHIINVCFCWAMPQAPHCEQFMSQVTWSGYSPGTSLHCTIGVEVACNLNSKYLKIELPELSLNQAMTIVPDNSFTCSAGTTYRLEGLNKKVI